MAMGSPGRSRRKPNTTTEAAATMRPVWARRAPTKRPTGDPAVTLGDGVRDARSLPRAPGRSCGASSLADPGALEEEHRQGIELEPLDPVAHEHVELELRERDHGHVLVDERQRLRVRLGALSGVELLAALVEQGVHLGVRVAGEVRAAFRVEAEVELRVWGGTLRRD